MNRYTKAEIKDSEGKSVQTFTGSMSVAAVLREIAQTFEHSVGGTFRHAASDEVVVVPSKEQLQGMNVFTIEFIQTTL